MTIFVLAHYTIVVVVQAGKLLPSAHAVEREYRIMKAVAPHGVPVPKTLALCEDSRYWYPVGTFCDVSALPKMFFGFLIQRLHMT